MIFLDSWVYTHDMRENEIMKMKQIETEKDEKTWKMMIFHRFWFFDVSFAIFFEHYFRNQAIWWFLKIRGLSPTIILKMKSCNFIKKQWHRMISCYFHEMSLKIRQAIGFKHEKSLDFGKNQHFDSFSVSLAILKSRWDWMKLRFIFGRKLRENDFPRFVGRYPR